MEKARIRVQPDGRFDSHHILPRCLGGTDCVTNLVKITPEEHYVAHQLLVKMYPGNGKLIWAALAMTGTGNGMGNGRKGNKLYGWLRRAFVENQTGVPKSENTRRNISKALKGLLVGDKHPLYGVPCPPERAAKISAANMGKRKGIKKGPMSEEAKKKLSASKKALFIRTGKSSKGSKHSQESKTKMSVTKLAKSKQYTFGGKSQSVLEWARELHIDHTTLQARINSGWAFEKVVTAPLRGSKEHHHKPFPTMKVVA